MRKSRISSGKQAKLIEHFVAGTTARTAARLVRVNKTTAAYYYHRLRELIYQAGADAAPFAGEIEVDESYFGGQRKGKRGRGAAGKVPVFGLLKRGGKVYAVVIANAKAATLLPILKERISGIVKMSFKPFAAATNASAIASVAQASSPCSINSPELMACPKPSPWTTNRSLRAKPSITGPSKTR